MTLETQFNALMEVLLDTRPHHSITAEQLIHSLDLTLLDMSVSHATLAQLNHDANKTQVAAVCVYVQHLPEFSSDNLIGLATVINFPNGDDDLNTSLASIEKAAQLGATEIDYVLPYRIYLAGQKQKALKECHKISQFCKQKKLTLKIILETGAFPDAQTIYTLSKELIDSGCDFLKTSTGKIPLGASLSSAFAILSAIKDTNSSCGIKISGGVKNPPQACNYAVLAELMIGKPINKNWFRIGASSLLGELLQLA